MMRILSTGVFLGAALALAATAQAQSRTFNLTLNGANEPNAAGQLGQGDLDALATGFLTVDPAADSVTWSFNYENISGGAISGFHIHGPNGTPTTNVSVFIGFPLSSTAVPNGTQSGTLLSADVPDLGPKIDQILANPSGFYVNMHSNGAGGFPAGAVRATLPEPGAIGLLAVAGLGLLRRRVRA